MTSSSSERSVAKTARRLIRQQQITQAANLLRESLEENPVDKECQELLGMALFMDKQFDDAQGAFEKLTRMDPMYAPGWVNLGAVLNVQKQYQKATGALRKAIQRDRRCGSAYYNLGIAQKGLKQNAMAASAYQEAIKLDPGMVEAYLNLGNLYMEMKNLKKAVQAFEQGLEKAPKSKKLQALLSRARQDQEGSRRKESPFGRLVNEEELATRQLRTDRRNLSPVDRNNEREEVHAIGKEIRAHTKPLVPILNDIIHKQLHVLHIALVNPDTLRDAGPSLTALTESMEELSRCRGVVAENVRQIREHLNRTDPTE